MSARLEIRLRRALAAVVSGDVLLGAGSRARYAADASPYRARPLGVVVPRDLGDLTRALAVAADHGVDIVPRGGGTGYHGEAVGEGLVIDLTRLDRFLFYDAATQSCAAEAGITPAALNRSLVPFGRRLALTTGADTIATLGGLIATDATGLGTQAHGTMREQVLALDVSLAEGGSIALGDASDEFAVAGEATALEDALLRLAARHAGALARLERSGGSLRTLYRVAALVPGSGPRRLAGLLAGSEGTLAVIGRVELATVPLAGATALGLCRFPTLAQALALLPAIASLAPVTIELIPAEAVPASPLRGRAEALLLVAFEDSASVEAIRQLGALTDLLAAERLPGAVTEAVGAEAQAALWRLRTQALAGLARPADGRVRVPIPELQLPLSPKLAGELTRIGAALAAAGISAAWHGAVGSGRLRLTAWAEQDAPGATAAAQDVLAAALARLSTGEIAARGIAGSELALAMRAPALATLERDLAALFDPRGRMNPGRLATAAPAAHPALLPPPPATAASTVAACTGLGLCRAAGDDAVCPSFALTRAERDSPRGRARTMIAAAAGEFGPTGLAGPELDEAMSLCTGCRRCVAACPNAVDVAAGCDAAAAARRTAGRTHRTERTLAMLPQLGAGFGLFGPAVALRNASPRLARLAERRLGLAAARRWPMPARGPLPAAAGDGRLGTVRLFVDCLARLFDRDVPRAAVELLAAAGLRVSPFGAGLCCGRLAAAAGDTARAAAQAEALAMAAAAGDDPILVTEPACRSRLQTLAARDARLVRFTGFSPFLAEHFAQHGAPALTPSHAAPLLLPHCHDAADGCGDADATMLAAVAGPAPIVSTTLCCGMGHGFGYRPATLAASRDMGDGLFSAIRAGEPGLTVVASGVFCRRAIADATGVRAQHPAAIVHSALAEPAAPRSRSR